MLGRFLDDESFVGRGRDFVKRWYGIKLASLVLLFVVCLIITILSVLFVYPHSWLAVLIIVVASYVLCAGVAILDKLSDNTRMSALELQTALFSVVANSATDLCMILRKDGSIIYSDPRYMQQISELEKKGIKGLDALVHSNIIDENSRETLQRSLKEGVATSVKAGLLKVPRSEKYLSLMLEPVSVPDIEEYKASQEIYLDVEPLERPCGYFVFKLQKGGVSESVLQYFDKLSIGFYVLGEEGELQNINNTLLSLLGYERSDLVNDKRKFRSLCFCDNEIELPLSEESWFGEVALKNSKSEIMEFFVSQKVVYGENQKITTRQGILVQKNANNYKCGLYGEALDSRVCDLIDSLPVATVIVDKNYDIVKSNKLFTNIAGKKLKKVSNFLDIIQKESRPAVKQKIVQFATTKKRNATAKPLDVKTLSNLMEDAALYVSKISVGHGISEGFVCSLVDITGLKNLEQKFAHSQKMQAVGQLAGGIAHDFNNLLTAMMGFSDLLLIRHQAGDPSFSDIMQIKQNANRASNLIRQLLAFSRKQTLQPEIMDITNVLADLSHLIGRLIGESIDLKMVHGRDLGRVKVDQVQLEQVVINLAVNARDSMPGGGSLTIKTSNYKLNEDDNLDKGLVSPSGDEKIEKGDYVLIEVEDKGCGIKKSDINKIFEPFYSTKEVGRGTGLGLATVYGIIKQTKGHIYVSSKRGKGTKFSIFLKKYEEPDSLAQRANNINADASDDLFGEGVVLLVEDENPVRLFSSSALAGKGYKVLEADSALVALDIVDKQGQEIDVIITDVVMPGMSGTQMVDKVRQKYPDIKIIFVSGYAEDEFKKSYGEDRGFEFLPKPYTLNQLATRVKEVLTCA